MNRWKTAVLGRSKLGITVLVLGGVLVLAGGHESALAASKERIALARAKCGAKDRAETGLQGQIPAAERAAGFAGFNCNLEKVGTVVPKADADGPKAGAGGFRQFALVRDQAGHVCGYGGGGLMTPGTVVVDFTDPNKPVETEYLMTPAMQHPGEGLRAHQGRGLLMSAYYVAAGFTKTDDPVTRGFDIYDVGTDCRHPKVLHTTTSLTFPTAGLPSGPMGNRLPSMVALSGHEGAVSLDGMTYYISDGANGVIHAIDVSNPSDPKWLAWYRHPPVKIDFAAGLFLGSLHGLSLSNDGNRAYPVIASFYPRAPGGMVPQTGEWHNGFYVVDTSEIQARKPNPRMRLISASVVLRDQSAQQMTVPFRVKGVPYIVTAGEGGTGQFNPAGLKSACAAGLTPFSTSHIFEMSDEQNPKFVSKIVLEANDPANCSTIQPEISTVPGFIYDVHMCSVDNRDEATALACGYFQSGIRVYDIRDPKRVKEIAYYNPGVKDKSKQPSVCGSIPILDAEHGMLYSHCGNSGMTALKFTNKVWPFPGSKTPPDRQL